MCEITSVVHEKVARVNTLPLDLTDSKPFLMNLFQLGSNGLNPFVPCV